ncbi:sulfurtransferase complex subunit TusB [Bibersteinia trehalosi]|uniref:sulfurtransferase complex subunit TusB n=1 Tax=Bibersteinia trehalosi TaxID=47735 RepID=UPI003D2C07E3
MLYTISRADYDSNQLQAIISQLTENDAIVLWQDGVLQAVKNPQFFANCANVFVLETDLQARGLTTSLPVISFAALVEISEHFYPQIAL